jgi:hypothetical protein
MSASILAVVLSSMLIAPEVPIQRPGTAPPDTAAPSVESPSTGAPPTDAAPTDEPAPAVEAAPEPTPTVEPAPAEPAVAPTSADLDLAMDDDALAKAYAESSDELDARDKKLRRANSMIAIGAVTATAGLVMLIGAVTEANKPDCKFDLDTCANAPRPAVARGLGAGAGIALAGGLALVGVGAFKRYKLRPSVDANATSVAITLRGRF